jgi:hypothetical protein
MECLLFALVKESKEAWQMIPVGLQLLVNYPRTATVFTSLVSVTLFVFKRENGESFSELWEDLGYHVIDIDF